MIFTGFGKVFRCAGGAGGGVVGEIKRLQGF